MRKRSNTNNSLSYENHGTQEPSSNWVFGFIKRHDEIKSMSSEPISSARAYASSPENVKSFFRVYEKLFDNINRHPSMIMNFDETMIQLEGGKRKVMVSKEAKRAFVVTEKQNFHVTLGISIFADGTHACPLIIFPLKTLPKEMTQDTLSEYDIYNWAGQDNGWIDSNIFSGHFTQNIIAEFKQRRQKLPENYSDRGLIVVDGHSTRANPGLMKTLQDNNIDLIVLPAHTSHFLQPCDNMVLAEFKKSMRNYRRRLKWGDGISKTRLQLLRSVDASLHKCMYRQVVKKSWEKTGLYPICMSIPLGELPGETPNIIAPRKKRKRIDINGKVLTSKDAIKMLSGEILTCRNESENLSIDDNDQYNSDEYPIILIKSDDNITNSDSFYPKNEIEFEPKNNNFKVVISCKRKKK